jgi:uncharacterized protein (TIGR02145 family)
VEAGPDYMNFGINANFWTTSEQTDGAYRVRIRYDEAAVNVETRQKYYGFSVRCVKDIESQATVPEVNTLGSSYYQEGDVYLMQGIVVSDGGSALTARGICYSDNNTEPTLSNSTHTPYSTTVVGTTFTVGLSAGNLTPGGTYYFRAYATNGVGTAYGETMSFVVADNLVVDSLPYDKGFTDGNSWYLNPSNNPENYWMIGVPGGTTSNALFITNDGSNAGYNEYATSEAYAVKVLYLPDVDSVTVEFDMQVGGEDSYDTLSAYLSAVGNENPRNEVLGSPSVVIITGISNTTMHVKEKMHNPAPDALAKLVFAWQNNGSATDNPISAIITNLKVTVDEATGDEFTCGTSTVQDKDGNEYNTVLIGSQCWMKENLRTTTYADNTPINNDDFTSVPDNEYIVETYGYLYSWYAMMNGADTSNANPSGVQGVCPAGWHVPSLAEFEQMSQYLINNGFDCNGEVAKTLAANTTWTVSTYNLSECAPAYSPSSNNSSGFSAYPAGEYNSVYDYYDEFESRAFFWTCSELDDGYGNYNNALILSGDAPEAMQFSQENAAYISVRCLKDAYDPAPASFSCGTSTIQDVDGNTYSTVQVGNQCWMKENLRTQKAPDGTAISGYYSPGYNMEDVVNYGLLYEFATAVNGQVEPTSDSIQGICPDGWHVPSTAEWEELFGYAYAYNSNSTCPSYAYARLLADSCCWMSSSEECSLGYNLSENNATGFSIRPAGYFADGYFVNFERSALFWTSDPSGTSTTDANVYNFQYSYGGIFSQERPMSNAYSIRCIKNE